MTIPSALSMTTNRYASNLIKVCLKDLVATGGKFFGSELLASQKPEERTPE